jgi:hypothetical protein
MNQKTVVLTVILFALIVIGMFIFARLRHAELSEALSVVFSA